MPAADWGTRFEPIDLEGEAIAPEELPLAIAVREGRPAYRPLRIRSALGEIRDIEITAFPIVGREGQSAAMAIFWD
jgi:hypothetical protein